MTTPMTTLGRKVHDAALEYRNEARRQLRLFELINDLEPKLGKLAGTCSFKRASWDPYSEGPNLELMYTGSAKSEGEAVSDLADVMLAFGCLFDDFRGVEQVWVECAHHWMGCYEGTFQNGLLSIHLQLFVPWHPAGCTIEICVQEGKSFTYEKAVCHKNA